MPKYSFTLTRDTTESVSVTIEADTAEEAFQKALENPPVEGWEPDDNTPQDPYLPDPDDVEEILPPPLQTFTVTRAFDAYIYYEAEIQARSAEEAYELAEARGSTVRFEPAGEAQFDHYDVFVRDQDYNTVLERCG